MKNELTFCRFMSAIYAGLDIAALPLATQGHYGFGTARTSEVHPVEPGHKFRS